MKKILISLLLAVAMILAALPVSGFAASDKFAGTFFPSGKISKPQNAPYLKYEYNESYGDSIDVYYYIPEDIQALAEVYSKFDDKSDFDAEYGTQYGYKIRIQLDGKLDNGSWQYKNLWDHDIWDGGDDTMPYYLASGYDWSIHSDETGSMDSKEFSWLIYLDPDDIRQSAGWIYDGIYSTSNEYGDTRYHYDLAGHTFSYRYRYVIMYRQPGEDEKFILGEWSDVASIGKNGSQREPKELTNLPAPTLSEFKLAASDDGNSANYYIDIPEAYYDGEVYYNVEKDVLWPYYLCAELNVDNKGWKEEYTANPDWIGSGYRTTSSTNGITENSSVQVRVRILDQVTGKYSPYSNTIGTKVLWENTSAWAQTGIQMAVDDGLFPECLEGTDLTKTINRQEFAAVAVKLYEAMSGTSLTADPSVSFTDCNDADVLKAATKVGEKSVVSGYPDGSFKPKDLLNRETAATMLGNVYLMMNGYASILDVKYDAPARFSDDKELSNWASPYVYFMSAKGVISGYDNNNGTFSFRPKNLANQNEAYGMCTREQALIIAEQMFQKMK